MLIYIIGKERRRMKTIKITTEYIKLEQLLKLAGYVQTGGEAKQFIIASTIMVDGIPTISRGKKIYPGSIVTIGDEDLEVCS